LPIQLSARPLAMLVTIAALTVLPAVIQGRLTNRWGPVADLKAAAEELQLCPDQIGDWKKVSEVSQLSPQLIRELRIAGYFERTYLHQTSGQRITAMIMVGPPGAISRHPPEICYEMGANQRLGTPQQLSVIDGQQIAHEFRLLRYQQAGQAGARFLVCYGFSVDGTWTIPEHPRLTLGGHTVLYKLQVLSDQAESPNDQPHTVVSRFLREFLPVFRDNCVKKDRSRLGAHHQTRQPNRET